MGLRKMTKNQISDATLLGRLTEGTWIVYIRKSIWLMSKIRQSSISKVFRNLEVMGIRQKERFGGTTSGGKELS